MRTHTKDIKVAKPSYHAYSHLDRGVKIEYPGLGHASMEVKVRLDHIWLSGWISAASSELGLKICKLLVVRLGIKSIGGCACGEKDGKADFKMIAFECEVQRGWTDKGRRCHEESLEEAHGRVMTLLRKRLVMPSGEVGV